MPTPCPEFHLPVQEFEIQRHAERAHYLPLKLEGNVSCRDCPLSLSQSQAALLAQHCAQLGHQTGKSEVDSFLWKLEKERLDRLLHLLLRYQDDRLRSSQEYSSDRNDGASSPMRVSPTIKLSDSFDETPPKPRRAMKQSLLGNAPWPISK